MTHSHRTLALLTCTLAFTHLQADTFRWKGNNNDNWGNSDNWRDASGTPGSGDTILFTDTNATERRDLDMQGDRTVAGILLDSNGTLGTNPNRWLLKDRETDTLIVNGPLQWTATTTGIVHLGGATLIQGSDATWGNQGSTTGSLGLHNELAGSGDITLETTNAAQGIYLIANNSYSGTFTLNQGKLFVHHNNALTNAGVIVGDSSTIEIDNRSCFIGSISGSGDISLGTDGHITVGRGGSQSYTGVFSGSGRITKIGIGNWILSDSLHTHTGTTTVTEGKLLLDNTSLASSYAQINSGGILSISKTNTVGNLGGNGTLSTGTNGTATILSATDSTAEFVSIFSTFNGNLTGSGTLIYDGNSSYRYNLRPSSDSFTGTVRINNGHLTPNATGLQNAALEVNASEGLELTTATTFGSLSGTGSFYLEKDLSFGGNNSDSTLSGSIDQPSAGSSGTLTKTGTGTFLFNGTKSASGAVSINGGTLGGTGTLSGDITIASAATLAPGNSTGTLTFNNDLTIAGDYAVEIDGTANDHTDVAGSLTLTAADLTFTALGGGFTETAYIIASYANLSGSFDSISGLPADYSLDYNYDDGTSDQHIAIVKDLVPPTLDNITTAAASPTNATSVAYTFTFSEGVAGFDSIADLAITTTDTLAVSAASITPISTSVYSVILSGITGEGTLIVAADTSSDIVDASAGNSLSSSVTSDSLTFERTAPTVTFNAVSSPNNARFGQLDFVANFSEAITGLDDSQDIYLTSDTTATINLTATEFRPLSNNRVLITLKEVAGDGILRFRLRGANITDLAGNAMASDALSPEVILDTTPPQLISTTASESSPTNADSIAFTFTFDEEMKEDEDFTLNLTATSEASVDLSQADISLSSDQRTYTFILNNITGDGPLAFTIGISGIVDLVNNRPLETPISTTVTIDNTAPTVASITTDEGTASSADSIAYSVTFSETVTNFDAPSDLVITTTGSATTTGATVAGSGDTYTVTLTGVSGDGTLALAVDPSSDVQDSATNPLAASLTSDALIIDNTAPDIETFTMDAPTAPSTTNASTITYQIKFTEPVFGLDGGNDLFQTVDSTATADLAAASITNPSGDDINYVVVIPGFTGDGSFRFRPLLNNVVDAANNPLEDSANLRSPRAEIDQTAPSVLSITTTETSPTTVNSLDYTVTFSEPVINFDAFADLVITTAGTASATGASISGSGDTYTVRLTGVSGDGGTLALAVDLASDVQDAASNALAASITSSAITIDNTAPTVASITTSESSPSNADSIAYTVTFSEAVTNFDALADLVISTTGSTQATGATISGSGDTYTVTLTGVSGDGTLALAINPSSGVQDTVNNALVAGITSSALTIDQTAPNAPSITAVTNNPSNADTVVFTVVFDEPVTNFDTLADLNIMTTGLTTSGGSITGSGDTYTVTLTGVTGNGTLAIQVLAGMTDTAGNAISSPSAVSAAITIDQAAPNATAISTTESGPTDASSLAYTVVFDEVVTGFDSLDDLDISVTGDVVVSGATFATSDSITYTVTLTGVWGDGTLALAVKTGSFVQDPAGNDLATSVTSATIDHIVSAATPTHYVNAANASPSAPYDSWATAAATLNDALAVASADDEIWIAAGVYYPDEGGTATDNDRFASFVLTDGVGIYGGFSGSETARSQRDPATHLSILSGDIQQNDLNSDGNFIAEQITDQDNRENANLNTNTTLLVLADGVSASTVLDGLILTAAHDLGPAESLGAVVCRNGASPQILNCLFSGNEMSKRKTASVYCDAAGTPLIEGCTFRGNRSGDVEGHIHANNGSRPTISDCDFGDASDNFGTVLISSHNASHPIITDCRFAGLDGSLDLEFEAPGNAVYLQDAEATVTHCQLLDSTSPAGGGLFQVEDSKLYLSNSSVSGIDSPDNSGPMLLIGTASAVITNCTFSGNQATNGGIALAAGNVSIDFQNCLFDNNRNNDGLNPASLVVDFTSPTTRTFSHSLVRGSGGSTAWNTAFGTDGGGNLDADPEFVTAIDPLNAPTAAGDFRLRDTSPALDLGNNAADLDGTESGTDTIADVAFDLAGNARIQDSIVDIGAFEGGFDIVVPTADAITLTTTVALDLTELAYTVDFSESVLHFDAESDLDITTTGNLSYTTLMITASGSSYELLFSGLSGEGSLTFSVRTDSGITDTSGNPLASSTNSSEVTRRSAASFVHYVNAANTNPVAPYDTWATAANTLNDALTYAIETDEIWVAAGVYYPDEGGTATDNDRNASFVLTDGVGIYGGFSGSETARSQRDPETYLSILSGDIQQNDINTDGNFIAEQFTDQDNRNDANLNTNTTLLVLADGVSASTVLDGLILTASHDDGLAESLGAVVCRNGASPQILNCLFSGNEMNKRKTASVYCDAAGTPLIEGCTFRGNRSSDSNGHIHANNGSRPTISDCDFGDASDNFGTVLISSHNASHPIITDCRFAELGGSLDIKFGAPSIAVYLQDAEATVSHCQILDSTSPATSGLFAAFDSELYLSNSSFSGLDSPDESGPILLVSTSSAVITNCTFSGNQATNGGVVITATTGSIDFQNCLFDNNRNNDGLNPASLVVDFTSPTTRTFSHSLVRGSGGSATWNNAFGTDGGGNLDADPEFVTAIDPLNAPTAAGDFRLRDTSPALDLGNNAADLDGTESGTDTIADVAFDLAGNVRIQDSVVDIGAFEGGFTLPNVTSISPITGPTAVNSIDFVIMFSEAVTQFDSFDDLVITTTSGDATASGADFSGSGAVYTVTLTGITGDGTFTLAVNTASDIQNAFALPLGSSVTSTEITIEQDYLSPQERYDNWASANELIPDDGFTEDPENDGRDNLQEYAYGLSPRESDPGGLQHDSHVLIKRGDPILYTQATESGVDFRVLFIRQEEYLAAGLIYTPQFSNNLTDWEDGQAPPEVLDSAEGFELVSVDYPFFLSTGKKARFFRLKVEISTL